MRYSLNQIYNCYQILVGVVENGLGAIDTLNEDGTVHDDYRIEYMREHVKAMVKIFRLFNEKGAVE